MVDDYPANTYIYCDETVDTLLACAGDSANMTFFDKHGDCESWGMLTEYEAGIVDKVALEDFCLGNRKRNVPGCQEDTATNTEGNASRS